MFIVFPVIIVFKVQRRQATYGCALLTCWQEDFGAEIAAIDGESFVLQPIGHSAVSCVNEHQIRFTSLHTQIKNLLPQILSRHHLNNLIVRRVNQFKGIISVRVFHALINDGHKLIRQIDAVMHVQCAYILITSWLTHL